MALSSTLSTVMLIPYLSHAASVLKERAALSRSPSSGSMSAAVEVAFAIIRSLTESSTSGSASSFASASARLSG